MDTLRRYLRGEFKPEIFHEVDELFLKTKLMVFVSSTFTDTHLERDLLHKTILPQLQKQALPENIEVILYDMRFGVKDENTKDHMTWPICKDGIRQCYEESDGMFFLSLQGNKYGYRPLPKYVDKDDMIKAFSRFEGQPELLGKISKLFEQWFELDENHVPPRYELKALQSLDDKYFYNEVLPTLRDELLQSSSFEHKQIPNRSPEFFASLEHVQSTTSLEYEQNSVFNESGEHSSDLVVGRSVTEWETLFALCLDENGGRCHWIRRFFDQQSLLQFKEHPADYYLLTDVMDDQTQSLKLKLEILKRKMKSILLLKNCISKLDNRISADHYLTMTKDNSKSFGDITSYLNSWKAVTLNLLTNELTRMIDHNTKCISFLQDSFNISLEYFEEISHHTALWKKKCSTFIGRQALVEEALNRFHLPVENHGSMVSLALIGKSGTGKTGLMSMMAKAVSESQSVNSIPIIIRYCGTSPHSLHGKDLIQSICIQLLIIYEDKQSLETFMKGASSISYENLIEHFHSLLSKYPVYLFIDSLDQLSNRNEARSKLHFLMSKSIHELSRIIVSALPDEKNEADNTFQYLYFCEQRLEQFQVPILKIEALATNEAEIKGLIIELMRGRERTFSISQWDIIWNSVVQEPTALYVNLAVEIISRWRSFDQNMSLIPTVKGIIDQLFSGLEAEYGSAFTRMGFAFITFSREGMNDIEMKDCLSLSENVLKEVFQYSKLESFPMHVWLRLKFVIKNLVAEKESHCIKWHHRQIWERAQDRYSSLKNPVHQILGKYFGNLIDETKRQRTEIHKQPLTLTDVVIWLPSSKINIRRIKEGYYHLVEANMNEEAIKEMCSLEMVCAAALLEDGYNFVAYLGRLSEWCFQSKDNMTELHQRLDHYYRWIRKEISAITISPRGEIYLTGTNEPMVSIVYQEASKIPHLFANGTFASSDMIWSRNTGRVQYFDSMMMNLRGHSGEVTSVSWNHDGTKIATGSRDDTIKIWDLVTGQGINTLEGHSAWVTSVSWNPEGTKIASASEDNSIKIWDEAVGKVVLTLEGHSDGVTSVSWNRDGTKIASGSNDNTIMIWDAITGQVITILEGHSEGVNSVSWNHDGTKIASVCRRNAILIWDIATGKVVSSLTEHLGWVNSVSWNHDGSKIVSGSYDWTIRIWDATIGQLVHTIKGHLDAVTSVSWNHDGTRIASGSFDQTSKIWDATTGQLVQTLEGHSARVYSVSWSHDGTKIASASEDNSIKIWDIPTGDVVEELQGHFDGVMSVSWNHDATKFASGSMDNTIKIWDESTGQAIMTLEGHSSYVFSVSWNPDGSKIASGSCDKTIKIWDATTGQVLNTLDDSTMVRCVSWNHDGSKLVSGSRDNELRIWDASTWQLVHTLKGHLDGVTSVSWNHDGTRIVSGSRDKTIKLWDTTTGQVVNTLEGHSNNVFSVSWNRDGTKIASASEDNSIKIWDISTGLVLYTLHEHSNGVKSVSWNHDGTKIASASDDNTVKIWNVITGQIVHTFEGHSEGVLSVSWNHDGSKIVSGSYDKTIKVWSATTRVLIQG